MWVISRGIYLGLLVLSFLTVLAFGLFTMNKEELVERAFGEISRRNPRTG